MCQIHWSQCLELLETQVITHCFVYVLVSKETFTRWRTQQKGFPHPQACKNLPFSGWFPQTPTHPDPGTGPCESGLKGQCSIPG